jgi:hypothetical protein
MLIRDYTNITLSYTYLSHIPPTSTILLIHPSKEDKIMKIWSTKYCLTYGIVSCGGEVDLLSPSICILHFGQKQQHLYGEGKEWHKTEASAIKRALELKDKKIQSLTKQLNRIQNLDFLPEQQPEPITCSHSTKEDLEEVYFFLSNDLNTPVAIYKLLHFPQHPYYERQTTPLELFFPIWFSWKSLADTRDLIVQEVNKQLVNKTHMLPKEQA